MATARRLLIVTVVTVAVLFTSVGAAQSSRWHRLDSPNFIVIGEVGASQLRDVAVQFEAFRETLGILLSEGATQTAVPTVVLVFRSSFTFQPFMPRFQGKRVQVGGLFVPRRDLNHIAMVSDSSVEDRRVVFHEYAHLLVSNTGQRLPPWLNEGIAEYYSTFELQRGGRDAIIGNIIENHLLRLNDTTLLKLPELLGVTHDSPLYNEGSRRSVFYAQAWALTHMLLRSQPSRLPQIGAYLNHLTKGVAPAEAWQQAFGALNIERELDNYIRRQAYTATRYRFTDRIASFEGKAVPVKPADAEAHLALYLVLRNELDDAVPRLAAAEKAEPGNPRTAIVNAMLQHARKDFSAAEKLIRATNPAQEWYLNYLAGVSLVAAMQARGARATADELDAVRRFFAAARDGKPEFANALARQASLELRSVGGPTADTRALLERAVSIAPGRHEYALELAQVLAFQNDFAAARNIIGPFMTTFYPEDVRENARSLMAFVGRLEESRQPRASTGPAGGGSLTKTVPSGPDKAVEPGEPVVRPVFRQLKPDEQRTEGVLERIDCVAGKGVTFVVKSGAETVLVTSPELTSVDFITYRKDLKGSVTCGPLAVPVYVTWRLGKTAGSRIAIAVEFLPGK